MAAEVRLSWTQPICRPCYAVRHPDREPVRVVRPEPEACVDCGFGTRDGILIRVDPKTARYPTMVKGD